MPYRKHFLFIVTLNLLLAAPMLAAAQQNNPNPPTIITTSAPAPAPAQFLPDTLAGAKAAGETRIYPAENLSELVFDQAVIFQEYKVRAIASRLYNQMIRVEVFQTESPYAAFGLFTYSAKEIPGKSLSKALGANVTLSDDGIIFWKAQYFIRIKGENPAQKSGGLQLAIASALNEKIPAGESPGQRPALFDSLPKTSLLAENQRYFLGPESLNAYIERARDMFSFDGKAEAVLAYYGKGEPALNNPPTTAIKAGGAKNPEAEATGAALNQAGQNAPKVKLVIVEYHTPQFATDALNRLNGYVATLSEEERARFITRRVGNFIVEAANFEDREFAESLINSIEYPYVVQWLQNPAIPTDDPFRIQKAGQMLVSTFSLIGLTGGVVLLCGSILGTTIFLKRRKQQREIFSDAGGMIGLHLDPIEDALLGLPPAKDE